MESAWVRWWRGSVARVALPKECFGVGCGAAAPARAPRGAAADPRCGGGVDVGEADDRRLVLTLQFGTAGQLNFGFASDDETLARAN
jgi:hypothetical protein